jgi:hypothetical protein
MKKILFLFIPLTLIGCGDSDGNGNTNVDPNETNNVLIVDGVEYPLESGTLLNYGGQQGLYNIVLDIYSPGVVVQDCIENSAIGQGHDIYFEIWTSQSDYLDSMTYNIVEDESESVGNITFSDYILDYNSDIDEQNWLEISLGTVDVLKSGDNYTISWNLTGELGEVITGNYSGTLMYCDISNNEPLNPDLVGTWITTITDDGTTAEQTLTLQSDGTGFVSNIWSDGETFDSELVWSATATELTINTLINGETDIVDYELSNNNNSFVITNDENETYTYTRT